MIPLARLRRFALACAPVWALGSLMGDGPAPLAALAALLLGCAALRGKRRDIRRQRPILHRLFFAWGSAALLWAALGKVPFIGAARYARVFGAALLCAVLCERLLALPIPRRVGWAAGVLTAALWQAVQRL